jgi:hypothetical protein
MKRMVGRREDVGWMRGWGGGQRWEVGVGCR